MRFYLQASPARGDYEVLAPGHRARHTSAYTEHEVRLTDGQFTHDYRCLYVAARSSDSLYICACLDNSFTAIVEGFLKLDKFMQPAYVRSLRDAWPVIMEALDNGMNNQFSPAALTVMEDPDDATGKWFVTTVVGNINTSKVDQYDWDRVNNAVQVIISVTDAIAHEFATRDINKLRMGTGMVVDGFSSALRQYTGFVRDNFGSLVKLLGT